MSATTRKPIINTHEGISMGQIQFSSIIELPFVRRQFTVASLASFISFGLPFVFFYSDRHLNNLYIYFCVFFSFVPLLSFWPGHNLCIHTTHRRRYRARDGYIVYVAMRWLSWCQKQQQPLMQFNNEVGQTRLF